MVIDVRTWQNQQNESSQYIIINRCSIDKYIEIIKIITKQADRWTDGQTSRQTGRQTDRQTDRHRKTDRQVDRRTGNVLIIPSDIGMTINVRTKQNQQDKSKYC